MSARAPTTPTRGDHIVQAYAGYYNWFHAHRSLGDMSLGRAGASPPEPVRRQRMLGWLLNHYEREAA